MYSLHVQLMAPLKNHTQHSCIIFMLQFALLEDSSVDDDLANLKKELSGSSKVCLLSSLLQESICFQLFG